VLRVSRFLLIVLAFAACGARSSGPAWPKSAGSMVGSGGAEDGGESIAPQLVAEVEEADDAELEDADEVVPAAEATDKPATPATDKPAAEPSVEVPPDEIFTLEEEIVIEVD
jgi:hypothetical protein